MLEVHDLGGTQFNSNFTCAQPNFIGIGFCFLWITDSKLIEILSSVALTNSPFKLKTPHSPEKM
jgi:hypothetical protein